MKNFLIPIFLTTISFCCFGQSFNRGETLQSNYYSEIPYENINDKIFVPVKIKGDNYRFLLDTGAPCSISRSLSNSLSLQSDSLLAIRDQSGLIEKMEILSLSEIVFGNITFDSIPTLIDEDDNFIMNCLNIDGVIGSNLLRNSILHFSSQKKQVVLTDDITKIETDTSHVSDITFRDRQSTPIVNLKFVTDAKRKKVVSTSAPFDSGSNDFYSLSIADYDQCKAANSPPTILAESAGMSDSFGAHGQAEKSLWYILDIPHFNICGTYYKNLTVHTTSGYSKIGARLLRDNDLTIDYINKKFYVQPHKDSTTIDLKRKYFSFFPTFENDKLSVGAIWDKKLAKKIEVGDEILSFNELNFENMTICDHLTKPEIYKDKEGIIKFRKRNGKVIEIFMKSDYFKKQRIY